MNFVRMPIRKDKPVRAGSPPPTHRDGEAFDLWLQRGLHQMFDDVASEPVPDDLLRLIEEDRDRASTQGEVRRDGDPEAAD